MATDISEIGFEQVIAALPQLDAGELAEVMDRASSLLKKAIGGVSKKKGVTPHQLERNHEWTKFVLADATMNGWEPFVMRTSKLNKETQEKEVTEVELRESVETEGGHVFADTGKSMSQGQAMCYGKLLRDRNDTIWQEFEAQYEQVAAPKASVAKVVKKTSQQVQEEKAAKEAAKEAEKARKAAEKEAEKRRKEEEKAAKEAAKKSVAKKGIIVPQPRPRSPAPGAAVAAVAAVVVEEEMPGLEPLPAAAAAAAVPKAKAIVAKKVVKEVRPAVDPFKLPEDCTHNVWLWKETQYLRDADNYLWLWDAEASEQGEFKGRYNYAKDEIEECEEPQFAEELDA